MRFASFSVLCLTSALALSSCSLFRSRPAAAPVVEAVRTEDSPTPKTAARDLADVMTTELQLTPDQTQRVRTVLNGTVEQANAAKAKYAPKSPELMAELKRINVSSQQELQVILGPTKFKQLQASRRKMAAEMQQRRQ
ncbi:hypothetical protein [Hymenobacter sp. IS2118]|uniref:hypothetical protein n=1 Tax=Hymenobacter sp. IS2118 TaxID=1505605 RepID=UPI000557EE6E|nr:hypothetical protein [Hymenobacter sp. IS2118]